LIIILLIVVVIFGAGRLSDIGGALGKGIREFRTATKDEDKAAAATTTVTTTAAPAAVVDNKCPSCGTANTTGQTFCGQCGTKLAAAV
jgi:sec-independent protein translocase protein TatA